MNIEIAGVEFLGLSILVLYLGQFLTRRFSFLERNNIPPAVTGGLLCSIVVALIHAFSDMTITFDMAQRDMLLLVFFSTIGLGAKFRMLRAGGKALGLLLVCASVFLVLQDVTGVGLAMLMGAHPGYGLFGGSVSFAGGHGTAIAWGAEAEAAGLAGARELGIAFATFGLIAGGIIGGPVAGRLIARHRLQPSERGADHASTAPDDRHAPILRSADILNTVLALAICVAAGDLINRLLFSRGVMLPGFLTAMLVGITLTNLADATKVKTSRPSIDLIGDVALQLFLSMSLLSMNLSSLSQAAGPIVIVLFVQMLVITLFAVHIVFRVMGRDYDAAVMSGGFVGLGLGATPVAIANMERDHRPVRHVAQGVPGGASRRRVFHRSDQRARDQVLPQSAFHANAVWLIIP